MTTINEILAILTPREKDIIVRRFGFKCGINEFTEQTLEEIGRNYSLTRERIRQIEKAAFEKLRRTAEHSPLGAISDKYFNKKFQDIKTLDGTEQAHELTRLLLKIWPDGLTPSVKQ